MARRFWKSRAFGRTTRISLWIAPYCRSGTSMNSGRVLMIGNAGLRVRRLNVAVALAVFAYAVSAGAAKAPRAEKANGSVHVQLQDAEGKSIAHRKAEPGKSKSAVLTVERAYQPGDQIV